MNSKPYIGGQAVIEGVMMRAPEGLSVAVRRPDGTIAVLEGKLPSEQSGLRKIPGVRGIVTLVESMSVGYRALSFSAQQQEAALATTALTMLSAWVIAATDLDAEGKPAPKPPSLEQEESTSLAQRGALLLSTLFALGLFIALPQGLTVALSRLLGLDLGPADWRFHAITGAFKLTVLTGYLVAISRIEEIRRVFHYHGAEHKTIYAYEAELPLTVENVRKQSRLHPRCGTTFLITVVIISVILGSIITPLVLPNARGTIGQLETLALRISLLPLIAAVSYELQRLSARYCTTGPLRVLLYPGFLFQKITTREPDDAQIEVAIVAMQAARTPVKAEGVASFESFASAVDHYAA
ncbi:MAG TPA: DUF1385 domain-containing protein [Gammaproteobacteria bacterium]|nr:DUF1385 domain-containing protein [Gammaproteobacteria bacterium]